VVAAACQSRTVKTPGTIVTYRITPDDGRVEPTNVSTAASPARGRRLVASATLALLACAGCAAATDDLSDAGDPEQDARKSGGGETPWSEAGMVGPPPPSGAPMGEPSGAPTAAPTGAPTAAPTVAPTAAPTGAPTAPPTQPPSEGDCVTDEDCGGRGMACFGGFCIVDPAAPQQVGDGACTNEADESVLHGIPTFADISTNCNISCLGQAAPCLQNCVANATDLSAACGQCYGAWVTCVSTLCLIQCGVVGEDTCTECRAAFCDPALGDCGGFAAPSRW
jgi:hypothetical protein